MPVPAPAPGASPSPSIGSFIVCMTLFIWRLHNVPEVSASLFAQQRQRICDSLLGQAPLNGHSSRSAANSALSRCAFFSSIKTRGDTCFVHYSPKRLATKNAMSTSSAREGLSDIGQSTTSNNNGDGGGVNSIPNWKERIDVSIAKSRKIRGSNYVQISTVDYGTMEPRCRTIVFRGFLKGVPFGAVKEVLGGGVDGLEETLHKERKEEREIYNCVMKMITDVRSNKVQELELFHEMKSEGKNANTVEMVWWFPKSSEQYRIRGRLQFIGSNGPLFSKTDAEDTEQNNRYLVAERKQQWGNLSDMAREQFYWENPGLPFSPTWTEAQGVPPGGRDDDGKVLPPPDTFLLMLLFPAKIDYLRLGDNYRQIDEWDWGGCGDGCHWKSIRVNP